jgi:hypothetical protein
MSMKKEVFYEAPILVHWVTGAFPCCEEHAKSLVKLGSFMGSVVPCSENQDPTLQCTNCINENKDKE